MLHRSQLERKQTLVLRGALPEIVTSNSSGRCLTPSQRRRIRRSLRQNSTLDGPCFGAIRLLLYRMDTGFTKMHRCRGSVWSDNTRSLAGDRVPLPAAFETERSRHDSSQRCPPPSRVWWRALPWRRASRPYRVLGGSAILSAERGFPSRWNRAMVRIECSYGMPPALGYRAGAPRTDGCRPF